jgi:hypothetical protein
MGNIKDVIQWQTLAGSPTTIGDMTVTPESSALVVRLPGRWPAAYVWNRPVAVVVQRGDTSERIPIVDVTRIAQLGLLVGTLAAGLIVTIFCIGRKEQSE